MISARGICKAFGEQTLIKNGSVQINGGDRFAIVGPNGSGKSTFLKMLLGMEEPDSGSIQFRKGVVCGYLPQESAPSSGATVLEEALSCLDSPSGADEARAKEILAGLGFGIPDFSRPVSELSGGWNMRVAIARLLVQSPDALLLDEPTNHLDLESLLWLERWLASYKGALLLISHDRDFIDKTTSAIISLEHGALKIYHGGYRHFVEEYEASRLRLEASYQRQQNELKRMQEFVDRNRARMSTAGRAQSVLKQMEKMELIEPPPSLRAVKIAFPQPSRCGLKALELKNAGKSYGGNKVYEGLDFLLERGQKIALVGKNGAGKSTLLKLLAGVIPPDGGSLETGLNVKTGYYSQRRMDMLEPERSVLDEAMDCPRHNPERLVRTVLGSFLFSGDAVYKKVRYLSGGEKSRLALVKLLLDPPNVLLLDEPTTHLDISGVEALSRALADYEGALCCISHDVYFLNSVANGIAHVEGGRIAFYPGGYEYFASRRASSGEETQTPPRQAVLGYEDRKRERAAIRASEKEAARLAKEREAAFSRMEELAMAMADPAVYSDFERIRKMGEEMAELQRLLGSSDQKVK
ncbi:MAG: ABC-F family ATP-binding cassette domain-containing protein [Elusimicrobiales bacterium]